MSAAEGDRQDERSDAELLAAHCAEDQSAFAVLVSRHQNRLWGLALRTLGNREDAADALQDGLLKAHRGAAGFRGESAVTTWLHRIVMNACLDRLRREASRPVDPAEPDHLDTAQDHAQLRADGSRAAELDNQVAARLDIEAALASLPPEQRAALTVVDVLGYDVSTAAEILDCPAGTVKSRCARGRARLAPLLAHLRNPGAVASVQHPDDTEEGVQR